MANSEKAGKKKGAFSAVRLPVSAKLIYPFSLRKMMLLGSVGGLAVLAYFFADKMLQRNRFVSSGPLSSNHASLENDCSACHEPFQSVANEKCSACHEQRGDRAGFYSHATHFVYRAKALQRVEAANAKYAGMYQPCSWCHPEHAGRQAAISDVADGKCLPCHAFGAFQRNHPQFAFAGRQSFDDMFLTFTHVNHVRDYASRKDVEKSCAHCHTLEPDGRNFTPINFDAHCNKCHLQKKDDPKHNDLAALSDPRNPCRVCHVVSSNNVMPVQKDQRVLRRAEFDHSTHVLLKKCLDCHTAIPMTKEMSAAHPAGKPKDGAAIQNIPAIENCRECHTAAAALDRCVTCHYFHPNKAGRFSMRMN